MKTNEQPPFQPKQFVRIKASGTILNVASCEKRVVHGALRWIVDGLNGMRAFADDCELIKNMELVNAETGQAVIHLPPAVRYACTKQAKVGDTVRRIDATNLLRKVTAVNADGSIGVETLEGIRVGNRPALQYEFVPDVTPVASPEFDFDEAANKAAAFLKGSIDSDSITVCAEWISDIISAQIRPGVQALYAKLQHRRCDTCGANTIDGCVRCGAPQCCPQCCKIDDLERRLNSEDVAHTNTIDHRDTHEASINAICAALGMEEHDASWTSHNNPPDRAIEYIEALRKEAEQLAVAKLLLGQCDNRLFLVGDFEIRNAGGGWRIYCPPSKLALSADDVFEIFRDPVAAALRAKELSGVAKGGAA